MGEGEAADDQTPFFQTQPAEHPLKITGLVSVHPFINPSFVLFSINVDYHKVRVRKSKDSRASTSHFYSSLLLRIIKIILSCKSINSFLFSPK